MTSFAEFWPFYCREHSRKATRWLHVTGSLLGPALAAAAVARSGRAVWLLLWPGVAYGFAWGAHFLVERNRPATFRHPLWSLLADYRMVGLVLAGRMDAEVARSQAAIS